MPPKRANYDADFKMKVVEKAKELGNNRKAAEHFGVNEKQVREWRKSGDKLRTVKKTAKRLNGAGRPVICKQLDGKLIAWLKDSRTEGHAISGKALQLQARRIDESATFKASNGWLASFKARHGLSTRQGTSIGQKLPKDAEEKLENFHAFVLRARRSHNYELRDIYNMDETPMKFDMPGNRTLHSAGKKTVMIRTNGAEKRGFTAVLTIAAGGRKLQPLVIFKGVRDPKVNVRGCRVSVQRKGYIDEMGKHTLVFITPVLLCIYSGIAKRVACRDQNSDAVIFCRLFNRRRLG